MLLICDGPLENSPHIDGTSAGPADLCAQVIRAALDFTDFNVVVYRRLGGTGSAAVDEAISALCASSAGRARVDTNTSLHDLLSATTIFVSFASPALVEGGWCGLKPVQVGRRLRGSAEFSHIYDGPEDFARALRSGEITGMMTLAEYKKFESFCRELAARQSGDRDPLQRACHPPGPAPLSLARTIARAIANPFAVMRLLLSASRAAPSADIARRARIPRKPAVAGGGNEQAR